MRNLRRIYFGESPHPQVPPTKEIFLEIKSKFNIQILFFLIKCIRQLCGSLSLLNFLPCWVEHLQSFPHWDFSSPQVSVEKKHLHHKYIFFTKRFYITFAGFTGRWHLDLCQADIFCSYSRRRLNWLCNFVAELFIPIHQLPLSSRAFIYKGLVFF